MIRSFETQLEACLPDLWRYAWSLTRDRDGADDLVQDCVERALRKRRLWIPGRPLKPWLTRMMLNLYRDSWRSAARRPTIGLEQVGDVAGITGQAEDRLEVVAVWKALETIPNDQREALLAVVVSGLSYDEAAAALGIPKGTLMSRIARARGKLRAETNASPVSPIRRVK